MTIITNVPAIFCITRSLCRHFNILEINNIPTHPSLLIHTNTANAHFPMSQVHEGEMAALTQQLNFAFDEFNNGGQFNTSSFSTSTSMGPVSTQTLDIQMGPVSTQKLDIKGSF